MMVKNASVLALCALALSACDGGEAPAPVQENAAPVPTPTPTPTPTRTAFNADLPGPDDTDPQALLDYWEQAVEANEREAARRAWRSDVRGGGTAPRWSNLSDIAVTFGEGRAEGAAGSSYYRVPVRIAGRGVDQTDQTLTGTITLRRVKDVPGADAGQLSWRIESMKFDN